MTGSTRWLKPIGLSFLLLATIGVGYQQWSEWRDARAFPMPGRLINVGDHRLHIWCLGHGSPTILMLAGGGSPSVNSYDLQAQLATTSPVCSYDRAGLGWSDPPKQAMGLPQVAADLESLLSRSGEKGPYVLVPESFGGMVALTMATRTPDQVAGIVAVDASEPDSWHRLSGPMCTPGKMRDHMWQIAWRVGLVRALFESQAPAWVANMSPKVHGQFAAIWSRPMASFANDWIDAYQQTPSSELPKTLPGLLGNKPLIVISHGRSGEYLSREFEKSWPQAQEAWTKLSTRGEHLIARDNGHPIAQENPQLVADAVAQVVADLRH